MEFESLKLKVKHLNELKTVPGTDNSKKEMICNPKPEIATLPLLSGCIAWSLTKSRCLAVFTPYNQAVQITAHSELAMLNASAVALLFLVRAILN